MSSGGLTRSSKAKLVLDIIRSLAESEDFLVSSVRTDNAKELARELIRKSQGALLSGSVSGECSAVGPDSATVFVEGFLKFSGTLVDRIESISTTDSQKSVKSERRKVWTRFHLARIGELLELWTALFNELQIDNSDTGKEILY